MTFEVSTHYKTTDLAINFMHPYTDQRHGGFPMSYTDAAGES